MLAAFRAGEIRTLIATDIAARGIDVDGISHVVNYDLPDVPESYVHRIGRTARAGAARIAISLCAGEEIPMLRAIERLIGRSIPATDRRTSARPSAHAHTNGRPPGGGKRRRRARGQGPNSGTPGLRPALGRDRPAPGGLQGGRPRDQRKPV